MILNTIAAITRARVEKAKSDLHLRELKVMLHQGEASSSYNSRQPFAFETALRKKEDMAFICEVKKASPSKGIIADNFPYLEIARDYEKAGAEAISVLTEPRYFLGKDSYLTEISRSVNIPVLRKDFIIDEYQIYEAKFIGADAILLICSLLDTETLKKFLELSSELGLSALVEAHTENEVCAALEAGARIIGVNNRNLQTFEVDLNKSIQLRSLVPEGITYIAESGVTTRWDILGLKEAGVDAVLIGEALMRSRNKKEKLIKLRC